MKVALGWFTLGVVAVLAGGFAWGAVAWVADVRERVLLAFDRRGGW